MSKPYMHSASLMKPEEALENLKAAAEIRGAPAALVRLLEEDKDLESLRDLPAFAELQGAVAAAANEPRPAPGEPE